MLTATRIVGLVASVVLAGAVAVGTAHAKPMGRHYASAKAVQSDGKVLHAVHHRGAHRAVHARAGHKAIRAAHHRGAHRAVHARAGHKAIRVNA